MNFEDRGFPRRRLASLALAPLVVGALAGCMADRVTYGGPFPNIAAACAEVASSAGLRDDDGPVSFVDIVVDAVDQVRAGPGVDPSEYVASGQTIVGDADGTHTYEWECAIEASDDSRSLTAVLTDFDAR